MHQTTLTDEPDDHDDGHDITTTITITSERESSSSDSQMNLAPPDQRGGEGCCPWCLAAPDTFEHHNGTVGCGHCDAAIPVGADWFERGETIVV